MENFDLVVADVVHFPVEAPSDVSHGSNRLLRLANSWLRRKANQHGDALMLIGVGFQDLERFRSAMVPYGLDGADLRVVDVERTDDLGEVGEAVAAELGPWLQRDHAGAIPVTSFPTAFDAAGYPVDAWWSGIESSTSFTSDWDDSIASLVPPPFAGQATTWAAVLEHIVGQVEQRESAETFRFDLAAAALARWLCGFDAASGNNFFNFEYDEVADSFGLNPFRLGFEAARLGVDDLEDEMDEGDDDTRRWAGMTVYAMLQSGDHLATGDIRAFFGGPSALFFALHTSIWPRRGQPAAEACAELLGSDHDDGPEIHAAWRFVDADNWSDIDDSL